MIIRTDRTSHLTLLALFITISFILLFAVLFLISGEKELLTNLLQNTVEGDIYGFTISAGGPVAIWIIIFVVLHKYRDPIKKPMKCTLMFERDIENPSAVSPPTHPSHFQNAVCHYAIFKNGDEIECEIPVRIHTDSDTKNPYVYVEAPGIEDPEYELIMKYNNREWYSDSFSPFKEKVVLR